MIASLFKQNRSTEYEKIFLWVWISKSKMFVSHEKVDGADMLEFEFWKMNTSSWDAMEEECIEDFHVSNLDHFMTHNTDKMKMFYLRYMFKSWNFDMEMTWEDDGGLSEDSFGKLLSLHPKILREIVKNLDKYSLSDEDSATIVRQSHLLFKKNGGPVSSPHKMISLYCSLTEMWQKFGLNYFDLKKMPVYERNALRKIISVEKQIDAQEAKTRELEARTKNAVVNRRRR